VEREAVDHDFAPTVVVLFDVDNTLLDNDRITADLTQYLDREVGPAHEREYWRIFDELREELGYADYLGAHCSGIAWPIRTTRTSWRCRIFW
jgi:FMN phosphatase YigB (HAD superfamily)